MVDQVNLLDAVRTYQEAVNRKEINKVLAMFTEDAEFELAGISKYSGKEQIKNVFEYDAGVNTELKFIDCRSEDDTVHCRIIERNDRMAAIGISEHTFPACTIVFRGGLIQSFSAEVSSEIVQYNTEVWEKFIPWCIENHPDEYSRIFSPEGKFIYNRENGRDVVPLLKKWREEQEK